MWNGYYGRGNRGRDLKLDQANFMDLDQPSRYSRFNIVTLGGRKGSNKWLIGYNMKQRQSPLKEGETPKLP